MTVIHTDVNDGIVKKFRDVISNKQGSNDADFKRALEDAMLDYIQRNSSQGKTRRLAETAKTTNPKSGAGNSFSDEAELYSKLQMLGVNVSLIRSMNPSHEQIRDLVAGLEKLIRKGYFN